MLARSSLISAIAPASVVKGDENEHAAFARNLGPKMRQWGWKRGRHHRRCGVEAQRGPNFEKQRRSAEHESACITPRTFCAADSIEVQAGFPAASAGCQRPIVLVKWTTNFPGSRQADRNI